MNRFRYVAPRKLPQALELLDFQRGKVKVLAGGTDLTPQIKEGKVSPQILLDIKGIRDLYGIQKKDDELVLGALTSLAEILNSSLLKQEVPYLVEAVRTMGSYQIRSRGTLGGNLCNASPAADTAPLLLALGASLTLLSVGGPHNLSLAEFFLGAGKSALRENEILTHIRLPLPGRNICGVYLKHTQRRAMDLAIVSVGALVSFTPDGYCQNARIAFGAVAPTPIRSHHAETMLEGKILTPALIREAGEKIKTEISPITDLRASLEYRREMAGVFLQKALIKLWSQKENSENA